MSDQNTRIAIIDANKCRPKRCAQECKKVSFIVFRKLNLDLNISQVLPGSPDGYVAYVILPLRELIPVLSGRLCIEVKSSDKIAFISEVLCIGCGICVKKFVFHCVKLHTTSLTNQSKDVLLKRFKSSTFLQTWLMKSPIVIGRTPSSCIVFLLLDLGRFSDWSGQMVSARVPH